MAAVVTELDIDRQAFLLGRGRRQGPDGRRRSSLPSDEPAKIVSTHVDIDDHRASMVGLGHRHLVRPVHQRPGDDFDHIARSTHWVATVADAVAAATGSLYFLRSVFTVLLGCAPTLSQCDNRS